jgi:hypothetical protein
MTPATGALAVMVLAIVGALGTNAQAGVMNFNNAADDYAGSPVGVTGTDVAFFGANGPSLSRYLYNTSGNSRLTFASDVVVPSVWVSVADGHWSGNGGTGWIYGYDGDTLVWSQSVSWIGDQPTEEEDWVLQVPVQVTAGVGKTIDNIRMTNGNVRVDDLTVNLPPTDPYIPWATGTGSGQYGLTGDAALKGSDPDNDGQNNLMEFATNSDPTSGASGPRCYPLMHAIGSDNALTYTMAVRKGATFAAAASPNESKQTATKDGVVYLVEGTKDLTTWNVVTVTEVTGDDATAVRTALGAQLTSPALGSDWEWHTFRTAGGTPTNTNDFIRLKVDVAP